MCLSVAIHRPNDVLKIGEHHGYQYIVTNNGSGFRCGYLRVPAGHPWHGVDFSGCWDDDGPDHPRVHGGVTFSNPDVPCGKGGADDAWWQGFDCAHSGDLPDPALSSTLSGWFRAGLSGTVRTQSYVEAECRGLAEQAHAAAGAAGFAMPDEDHRHEACETKGGRP